jgi:general L-amino acid transport system permease protein
MTLSHDSTMTATLPPNHNQTLDRPAALRSTPLAWVQKNLFSTWSNSLITIVLGCILISSGISFVTWAATHAKWAVIPANLTLFMAGRFPADQFWRLWVLLTGTAIMTGLSWGIVARQVRQLFSRPVLIGVGVAAIITALLPARLLVFGLGAIILGGAWVGRILGQRFPKIGNWLSLGWMLSFGLALWMLAGGAGLKEVSSRQWGGLLLTMFMAIASIVFSFPLAVILALGRQSTLPMIKWLCTGIIEITRGTPLTALLFVGDVLVPLFLSGGIRPDSVLRAIVGLTIFCAVYTAETIRGGMQAIPKGQGEAARALGLSTPLAIGLIVLPQALKLSIPALVGMFIQMVQETTLVSILGLTELLGMSKSILANPEFLGRYAEVYLFIGALYWAFCYAMSLGSRRLERALNTTH